MEEQQIPQEPEVKEMATVLDTEVASGPIETPQIEKVKRIKTKKKTAGDFLKVEGQIKRRDAIKAAVKPFKEIIRQAKSRNANESDTANIVHKFFQDVLGWDFLELTTEYKIKNSYCDLAIKYEGEILLLIEVKAIGLNLKEDHLTQASAYAANEGVRFVMLTNGEVMRVYHVGWEDRVTTTLVWEVDFSQELSLEDLTELYLITKHSLPKEQLEEYWELQKVLSEDTLIDAILSDDILQALSKYIRYEYEMKVDVTTLKTKVESLLRAE